MDTKTDKRRLKSAYSGDKPTLFLEPAPHECKAFLNFEGSLKAYYALDRAKKDDSAPGVEPSTHHFDYGGESFELSFRRKSSGFIPPDRDDYRLESVPEFVLDVEAVTEPRKRHVNFVLSPRCDGLQTSSGAFQSPDFTGVSVHAQGANLSPTDYPQLLRFAAETIDVNPRYFDTPHKTSTLYEYERYVRIRRSKSSPIHKSGGTIEQLFEHITDIARRREFVDDNTKTSGFYNVVRFDSDASGSILSGHSLGKQVKHYHPKHPRSDANNPLYHPKLGVLFRSSLNRDTVRWDDVEQVERELDETLLNVLSWSGLPTRSDSSVYVSDAYFDASESYSKIALRDNPLPQIRREQNALVVENVSANPSLEQSDVDVLEVMTDGGSQIDDETTAGEIASETDWSRRTVYRVLERLDGVLTSSNGSVRFASSYLRDSVGSLLGEVRDALERDEKVGESQSRSVFQEWCRTYGVEVTDDDDAFLQLRLGRLNDKSIEDILRDGYRAWRESGRVSRRFKMANVVYHKDGFTHHKSRALR